MSSFRTNLAEGIADLLETRRDADAVANLSTIEFSSRTAAEPDLPAIRCECASAPENALAGMALYDAQIDVTLESSLNEDDGGALHEERLAWLEGVLCAGSDLIRDWRKPGVRIIRARIVNYETAESDGRRADTITLEAAAHPWA